MHRAKKLGYHPQVILAGRAINDSMPAHVAGMMVKWVKRGREDAAERFTVFDQTFVKSLRVRNVLRVGLQFLVAKMDGVIAVAHDEFRGMGLSGVREFMDEGAVRVDGGTIDGEEVEGEGFLVGIVRAKVFVSLQHL